MIKIYDDERNLALTSNEHNNLYISRDRNEIDVLGFTVAEDVGSFIKLESYIETSEGTFVVKEKTLSGSYSIVGVMDLEDFDYFVEYEKFEGKTLAEIINSLVSTFGWTVVGSGNDKQTVTIQNMSVMEAINECVNLFKYEVKFNNKEKIVNVGKELGSDKGVYFHSDLNLKRVEISSDSYDFATRILPVGKDDLTIESVNNGNKFLEDYTYTDKVKTVYWEDNRYTIPENLKATAQEMLDNLSKPLRAFNCEIVDLVNNSKYDFMDFDVGDTITIIDSNSKIKEKHRITSHILYIDERHKGSVRFENKPRDIIDRFTEFDNKFGDYDSKFNDYDYKLDGYDSKFNDYDFKMEDLYYRLDNMDFEFGDEIGNRLDILENLLGIDKCTLISISNIDNINEDCVIIPSKLNGKEFSNLGFLFSDRDVLKVNKVIMGSKTEIIRTNHMFDCSSTNEVKHEYLDLSEFDSSNVIDMSQMFADVMYKYIDLSSLDTSRVTDMSQMFSASYSLKEIDISNFNTSNVVDMSYMFSALRGYIGVVPNLEWINVGSIDTSSVENMSGMFEFLPKLEELDLSGLDTSSVKDMSHMFSLSEVDNLNISNFDTSNVEDMSFMFRNFKCNELDLSSFSFSNNVDTKYMLLSLTADVIYVKDEYSKSLLSDEATGNNMNVPIVVKQ